MAAGKAYEDALLSKKGKGNPHPKRCEIKRKIFHELFRTTDRASRGYRYAPQRGVMMRMLLLELFESGKTHEAALLSSKGAKGNPYPKRGEIKMKIFRQLFGTEAAGEKQNGGTEDGWGGSFAISPQKA